MWGVGWGEHIGAHLMQTIVLEKACNIFCLPVLCSLGMNWISIHAHGQIRTLWLLFAWKLSYFGLPWYHYNVFVIESLRKHSPAHILSKPSSPFRLKLTTMRLWHLQLRTPCLAWLCCWGPWGSGCVATAPGSWPSTIGPLPVCCSGLAHTLTPARWAQLPTGPPLWRMCVGLVPARRSHLSPLWDRSSLKIT